MEKITTENEKYEKMWFEHAKRMHNELKNVNGIIRDADTMLDDIMGSHWDEFHEQSGVADELFSIYEQAADKNTFRQMFKLFVGCELDEFCQDCVDVMEKYEAAIYNKKGEQNETDY